MGSTVLPIGSCGGLAATVSIIPLLQGYTVQLNVCVSLF